jgi:hypothetical protein
MFQNLIDIIAAPSAAFARIKEKPVIWLPLLLILVFTASAQLGYFLLNDPGFVKDTMLEQATANPDMSGEQRDAIEGNIENMNINTLAISSTVAVMIFIPLILALNAWYLSFMSKFSFTQLSWKHWFSLLCWTGIPGLFAVLASWLVLLTDANGQVDQLAMQPLSIVSLLGLETRSATLQQINLMTLWAMALVVMGYKQWTGKSLLSSAFIALIPYGVLYGGIILATI